MPRRFGEQPNFPRNVRFFGILVENAAGDFPVWLSPVQMKILPVTDSFRPYCEEVQRKAKALGIRAEVDQSENRLNKMIRNAELEKVPVVAVVGQKEIDSNQLAIRTRKAGDIGTFDAEELLGKLAGAIKEGKELEV
mmetsp:Transcript_7437/g.10457  ORF Transcript_7437/g.10457 Transcript_7437/m.10457 type:complete len:137 (-) Transcript_7437:782-1192(-)